MKRATFILMAVFISCWTARALAQGAPVPGPEKKEVLPLIDEQLTLERNMKYSFDGREIRDFHSLENIILPLSDARCAELLRASKDRATAGLVFIIAGGMAEAGGVIIWSQNYSASGYAFGQDYGSWGLFLAGGILDVVGVILQSQSEVDKFNAVKRYNSIIRNEQEFSFFYDQHYQAPELVLMQRF